MPTFSHGSRARIYVSGWDLSAYFRNADSNDDLDTADATAFADTHKKVITGLADGRLSLDGMFDASAGASVPVLRNALSDQASEVVHWFNTDAVGNRGHGLQGVETAFNITTPVTDIAAVTAEFASNTAMEPLWSLIPKASEFTAGTTVGGTVDASAVTVLGAAGYLHLFTYGGAGSVVASVQHSANGSTGWADIITFAGAAADNVSQRATMAAGTVERYLRGQVIKTGAGTATMSVGATKTPQL